MLKTITEIARGCGQIILSAGTDEKNADKKSSWRDPVTVYDKRVQEYAAGALIVEEAGGICRTINDEPLQFDRPCKSTCMAGPAASIERFMKLRIM